MHHAQWHSSTCLANQKAGKGAQLREHAGGEVLAAPGVGSQVMDQAAKTGCVCLLQEICVGR